MRRGFRRNPNAYSKINMGRKFISIFNVDHLWYFHFYKHVKNIRNNKRHYYFFSYVIALCNFNRLAFPNFIGTYFYHDLNSWFAIGFCYLKVM